VTQNQNINPIGRKYATSLRDVFKTTKMKLRPKIKIRLSRISRIRKGSRIIRDLLIKRNKGMTIANPKIKLMKLETTEEMSTSSFGKTPCLNILLLAINTLAASLIA